MFSNNYLYKPPKNVKTFYVLNTNNILNAVPNYFYHCITIHLSNFKIYLVFALYSGNSALIAFDISEPMTIILLCSSFLCFMFYVLFNLFLFIHLKFCMFQA